LPELLGLKRIVPPVAGTPFTETLPVTVASVKDESVFGLPSPQPCTPQAVRIAVAASVVEMARNRRMSVLHGFSILVCRDHFITRSRAKRPPRGNVDRRLDCLHRAVAKQHVDHAGMVAARDVRDLQARSAAPRVGRHYVNIARQGWLPRGPH